MFSLFNRKNKTTAVPVSTSPKEPEHFNKDAPEALIICASCREPLWQMLVRHHKGRVVSTRTLPVGKNSCKMGSDYQCPLCLKSFATNVDGERKIVYKSLKTGKEITG